MLKWISMCEMCAGVVTFTALSDFLHPLVCHMGQSGINLWGSVLMVFCCCADCCTGATVHQYGCKPGSKLSVSSPACQMAAHSWARFCWRPLKRAFLCHCRQVLAHGRMADCWGFLYIGVGSLPYNIEHLEATKKILNLIIGLFTLGVHSWLFASYPTKEIYFLCD